MNALRLCDVLHRRLEGLFNKCKAANWVLSKVYWLKDCVQAAEKAGMQLLTQRGHIDYCHSLLRFCKR